MRDAVIRPVPFAGEKSPSRYPGRASSRGGANYPYCDCWETEESYVFCFDLPGLTPEQFKVQLIGHTLTVAGRRDESAPSAARHPHSECRHGSFERRLVLPPSVRPEAASATYDEGVLQVVVPKAPPERCIQVEVKMQPHPTPPRLWAEPGGSGGGEEEDLSDTDDEGAFY